MNRKKIIAFLIAVALVAALMWLPEYGNDANPDNRAASDQNSGSVNEYVTGNEDGDSSEENICVDELSQANEYPLVSGHRGANDIAPENTMASADSCIKYGIEIMDPDVVATNIKHINKKFVEECHSRNIKVLALILGLENKSKLNRKALEYGVDIVATDRPKACKQQYIQSEFLTTSLKTRK